MSELQSWEEDPALYLFTSLTAGSSHIVTATSRIETILKNARIPFSYIDTATNESARKLYGRRGKNRKLPLLVKEGFVIADLTQVEEWNEFGELHQNIGEVPTTSTSVTSTPAKPGFGSPAGSAAGTPSKLGIATPHSNASSPAAEREIAERQKETASIGSIRNNPFMKQLASDAASKAKARIFGAPKPTPKEALQDTTNTASQPVASVPSKPAAIAVSPLASPSAEGVPAAVASPTSPRSPSRHSSHSSRHSSFVPEHPSPVVTQHRGSEVSLASQDEIKEIEKATMIPEEDEGDDTVPCIPSKAPSSAKAPSSTTARPAAAAMPSASDIADLQATLARVGTDLSLAEDAAGLTSPMVTTRTLEAEDHAATPAASSPIEQFEAQLSRTGTGLTAVESAAGLSADAVATATIRAEDHADTPAATAPLDAFEAVLARVGTGLAGMQTAHRITSADLLEAELEDEDHADTPAATAPREVLEARLGRAVAAPAINDVPQELSAGVVAGGAGAEEAHVPAQKTEVVAAAAEEPAGTVKPAAAAEKPVAAAEKPVAAAEHVTGSEAGKTIEAAGVQGHPTEEAEGEKKAGEASQS